METFRALFAVKFVRVSELKLIGIFFVSIFFKIFY
jgi:hypothetical protein